MKLVITIILLLMCRAATCQKKVQFHSLNYAGIMTGDASQAAQLHSVNGIMYKTWFTGAGVGIDWYYQRTVPIYFSVSKFLNGHSNTFFLSGDIGTNYVWDNSTANHYNGFTPGGDFTPSLYYAAHVGYRFAVTKRSSILLNAGYSEKQIRQAIVRPLTCPNCGLYTERFRYNLKRLSFRIGWMF